MTRNKARRRQAPPETLDWALSWSADRDDDRQGFRIALGFAVLIHAAFLVVRFADKELVVPPPIDAVIYPTTNVAIKPDPPPPPEPIPRVETPTPVRVPVPAELAPPEPLPAPAIEPVPITMPPEPLPELVSIPEIPPPPLPSETPVRFRGEMRRPVRIGGAHPAYTEVARKVREEGTVILDAVIDKTGRVTEIEVLKRLGFGLTEAAVTAVSGWLFEPAALDGKPVAVRYTLTVRFALQ